MNRRLSEHAKYEVYGVSINGEEGTSFATTHNGRNGAKAYIHTYTHTVGFSV